MTMPTPDIKHEEFSGIKLGLCQVETKHWDLEGNFQRTEDALRDVAKAGAELAITPENVLQGYPPPNTDKDRQHLREVSEPLDGKYIARLKNLVRELSIDIVFGFAEVSETGHYHNSCLYMDCRGDLKAVYRKVHCRPFEDINHDGLYTPGSEFRVATFKRGDREFKIGMMICFDREIPESVRCLRSLGAQLIACPLATNTARVDQYFEKADNELLTRARSAENELFIAVVNHSGTYNGGTFVTGPSGEMITQLGEGSETEVLQVPVGIVPEKFHADPLGWAGWGYRRPNIYKPYLEA